MKIYLNNIFAEVTFFYKLFEKIFNTKIELSTLEDSEILFESVFGNSTLLYHKKWLYTILFIGESDRRLPLFMNERLAQNTLKDYSLILKGEHDNNNVINLHLCRIRKGSLSGLKTYPDPDSYRHEKSEADPELQ